MKTIKSVCPECNAENNFYLSTNAEYLAEFKNDLEKEPDDLNTKNVVKDFESRTNQNEICTESLANYIGCKCGCDYDIKDSKNWNEIENIINNYEG